MKKIDLLVVDDHGIVREGIRKLLEDWPLLGSLQTASSAKEAELILNSSIPTVNLVLLDVSMPGRNGFLLARDLRKVKSDLRIVILSSYDGEALLLNLLKIGVHGFVKKEGSLLDLQRCLENVWNGKSCFPTRMQQLAEKDVNTPDRIPVIDFNWREWQIIPLLMQGHNSKQIAHELNLSERTITTYREKILRKTNTQSAAELVAFIKENGLAN